jgi:tetratricopeptide (TPR) repeat protein
MKRLLAKARQLYKRDHYRAATAAAMKVLSFDKNNQEALFYVAHGLYYAKQLRRSLQYWKRLKKLCPTEPYLHLNVGACYEDLSKSSLAIQNYKRELELNPVCGPALYNLGAFYYRMHKYKLAIGYLERCYSQKHSVDACICKLAHSYFKTGQLQKEQLLYEEFLQTHPNDTWALNNLGSHLMGQGQYYRALIRLKKAARLDPTDKLVAKNIRKAERDLKRLKKSLAAKS